MVVLTADVHHMSLKPRHAAFGPGSPSEVDCLLAYLRVVRRHGLKVTVFVTGKAAAEQGRAIRDAADPAFVEIGGHTYSAFRPKLVYGAASRLLRLSNGPAFFQDRDIRLSVRMLHRRIGVRIACWRDHAYRQDRNTCRLLHRHGIRFVSDAVMPLHAGGPLDRGGVLEVPINTTPDHENLRHYRGDAPFDGPGWARRVAEESRLLAERGADAVILAHPSCMYAEDRFAAFDELCRALTGFRSGFVSEVSKP